jgi:hypothetical protein
MPTVSAHPHTRQAHGSGVSVLAPDDTTTLFPGAAGPEAQGRAVSGADSPSPTPPPATAASPWLVVTGQNCACKPDALSVAGVLGVRFPCRHEVTAAAEALAKVTRVSPLRSQIEVSPGSVRFRYTVPPDDRDDAARPQAGSGRQAITSWTLKSRRQMLRSFASLDYGPMFADGGMPARVTLTYPPDWLTVAPDGAAVERHFRMLERRHVRAWGERVTDLWKLEFQERGAPHYHQWQRRPSGVAGEYRRLRHEAKLAAWEASGRAGRRPRYRPAVGDGLQFRQWLAVVWADVVNHPDPVQRALHEKAGTQVDIRDALKLTDPKRASVYFSKHGLVKGSKEYQNQPPAEWTATGGGPGRYWGYRGLEPLVATVQVDGGQDYQLAKRTMRRWVSRTRIWDPDARAVRYVKVMKTVRVKRGKRYRMVRRPAGRLGGRSGTLCVNDGPLMAGYLARVLALSAPAPRPLSGGVLDLEFVCEACGRNHPLREHRVCRARASGVVRLQ